MDTATAAGTWGNSYTYDGWGNLLTKTVTLGSAQSYSTTVDPSTNGSPGASGAPYTAPSYYNGGSPIDTNPYDVEGRKITDGAGTWYVYDPWGRRIWQETPSSTYNPNWTCKIVFYAVTGKRIENFNCLLDTSMRPPVMTITPDGSSPYFQWAATKVYFGTKLIMQDGNTVGRDRLGSVRSGGSAPMSYFPYGEERTGTANGQEKFGAYFRDPNGDDYAMARTYQSNGGRFATADPRGIRAANSSNPISWNRMAYAVGDPVSVSDPLGTSGCDSGDESCCDPCEEFADVEGIPKPFCGPPQPPRPRPPAPAQFLLPNRCPVLRNADHRRCFQSTQ